MVSTIIPENRAGKQNDIVFSKTLETREAAADCFNRACKRVLNPNLWHELTGWLSASVQLFTGTNEARRLAALHDYFRIDIPGPGPHAGGGYDWVQVAAIEDKTASDAEEELFAMRLHPVASPQPGGNEVAHFFNAAASSTFVIHRQGTKVTASYHGRNELPNNKTDSAADNLRNSVIAAGAAIGLSEAQWSTLMHAFLQEEIGG